MFKIENITSLDSNLDLENYIKENIQYIFDYFNQNYTENKNDIQIFKSFINSKFDLIKSINYSANQNIAFISLLSEYCERYKLSNEFIKLYELLKEKHVQVYQRQDASYSFLKINKVSDYLVKLSEIFTKIEFSFKKEDDNEKSALLTFANFISTVSENTTKKQLDKLNNLIQNIKVLKQDVKYNFLNFDFVENLLNINFIENQSANEKIQNLIDTLLGKVVKFEEKIGHYIIEDKTEYSKLLLNCPNTFYSIQQICKNQYVNIKDDNIFKSLQRGVGILSNYEQLFAYFYSYSDMHQAKLLKAFDSLKQTDFYIKDIEIFDWACGQGLASMVYLDYTKSKKHTKITLIEPSEIALKRGSLHVKKINPNVLTTTINKDIDNVQQSDLITSNDTPKLHLFSNIIDVDLFSLSKLLDLLQTSFKGENYFVCVSPYITDLKTARIDSFVSCLKKHPTFCLFDSVNLKAGDWVPGKNWSIVMRVFKVVL